MENAVDRYLADTGDDWGEASAEWAAIVELVSAWSPPSDEAWLGRLAYEAQRARDRVTQWASEVASSMLAEAEQLARESRPWAADAVPAEPAEPAGEPALASVVDDRGRVLVIVPFRPPPLLPSKPTATPGPRPVEPLDPPAVVREAAGAWITALPARPEPVPIEEVELELGPSHGARHKPPAVLAAIGLAVVAAVAALVGFETAGTAAIEHGSQRKIKAEFSRLVASPSPPSSVAGLLSVPRLGLNQVAVVEGATLGHLRDGPARETTSAIPGQAGAVVILGHRTSYGGPFAHLARLRLGDSITLRTAAGTFVYRVSRTQAQLAGGPDPSLTLPSASAVGAAGGRAGHADQDIVLATGTGWTGAHLAVVVATLWLSNAVTVGPPGGRATRSSLRAVPGQPAGALLAEIWLLVIALAVYWAPRSWSRLPPVLSYGLVSVVVLLGTYQLFLGIDRMLPGSF